MATSLAGAPAGPLAPSALAARDALAAELRHATDGTFRLLSIYIGDQLGFYAALADGEPLDAATLAARTATQPRYVREWLEQQAASGVLLLHEGDAPGVEPRFSLPPGHAEVLADADSVHFAAPIAQLVAGAVRPVRFVLDAFRHGGGVPYGAYGAELREGRGRLTRAAYLRRLGPEWLASHPALDARLRRQPAARVADVGCGVGWAGIAVALSYPGAQVDGLDLDAPSVERARGNARDHGVADRVRFHVRDAAEGGMAGRYDLVMALDCIPRLADPIRTLRAMARLASADGVVIVGCAPVAEALHGPADEAERLAYGWSLVHELPAGMAQEGSAATGGVLREPVLRRHARQAGFTDVTPLGAGTGCPRLYVLHR